MNKVTFSKGQKLEMALPTHLISQDDAKKMSKYRVIQKNLVHVQGFPDSLLDSLEKVEFLGQFGKIVKLVVVKGKEEELQPQIKKSNSAYITFFSNEEAAHAVLAVDSCYYENHLIRAFFGTSKYCIHFLNNKECYNKDKCMYLHSIASEEDVLGNTCGVYSKFDYTEHLQIAITTSGILSKDKKDKILQLKLPKTVFPNIKSIYTKDIVLQAEKCQLDISSPSFILPNNTGKGSTRNSTNDEDSASKSSGKLSENIDQDYQLYHYRPQSRFFSDMKKDVNEANIIPFYIIELVDKLSCRYSFFKQFNQPGNESGLKKQQEYIFNDTWSEFIN